MIQINLLKSLDTVPGEKSFKSSSSFFSKRLVTGLILFVAVAAVVVGIIFWPSGDKQREKPEIKPERETSVPQKHMSEKASMEKVVKDIKPKQRKGPRYTSYMKLTPAEKIAHQQVTFKKALTFLKKVTPKQIGFTNIIITTPGDLYLRGMASSNEHYLKFKQDLSSASFLKIKPGIVKPVGASDRAREFSLYGMFEFKAPPPGKGRIAGSKGLSSEISRFKRIAKASGLQLTPLTLKSKKDIGRHRRYIYKTRVQNCSFESIEKFVNKLYISKSKTGILKLSLKAEGDEVMNAEMDVVLYTK